MKLPADIKAKFRRLGRKGGKARAESLPSERRSEIARLGGLAKAQNAMNRLKATA